MIQGLCLRGGILMGHEPDLGAGALSAALLSFRPTYLYAVPSVFEKIYKNFLRTAQQTGRASLFERAVRTAQDFALAEERHRLGKGSGPGFDLRLQHSLYEKTVYKKLRAALGGRVCGAVSGGSPLNRELTLFYAGIGIFVHDGYGLTETAGGITAQPVGREKFGTVGRPLPGTDIHVADDGEIFVSGPSVFQGYLNDAPATQDSFLDGWLATGDVGRLDFEGYLTITGRKKEIIITSSGKSVAPRLSRSVCGSIRSSTKPWWWVTTALVWGPSSLWIPNSSRTGARPGPGAKHRSGTRARRTNCGRRSGARSPRPTAPCPARNPFGCSASSRSPSIWPMDC